MIRLAKQYGRYGYRKIAQLLRIEGWVVNHKKVERLWREEVLNAEWFSTLKQAQAVINNWLTQYNLVRPHQALSMRPPVPETLQQTGT